MRRWVGYRRAAVLPEIGRLGFAVGAFSEEEVSIWTALHLYVDHLERRAQGHKRLKYSRGDSRSPKLRILMVTRLSEVR